MQPNILVIALAALVPLVMGFIWYHPKVFGTAWMKAAGVTEESKKGANMALIFGLTYVFSFLVAFALNFMVVHQWHMYSILMNTVGFGVPGSHVDSMLTDFMNQYGHEFRSYRHGALHGFIGGMTVALPIISVNALFERKGFKYIALNAGFWIVCFMIMGAIICEYV